MGDRKRFMFTAIAVSLVAIAAGLSIANGWLPSFAAQEQYREQTWEDKTVRRVVHTHDGLPEHEHIVTVVVATTEGTPHGTFHDFAAVGTAQVSTTASAAPAPAPGAAPTPGDSPAQAKYDIVINGREFAPSILTIPVGAKVTWTNKDGEMHTVTSDKFSGGLAPLTSFSHTFTEPGVFDYHCDSRPEMTGKIIVEEEL